MDEDSIEEEQVEEVIVEKDTPTETEVEVEQLSDTTSHRDEVEVDDPENVNLTEENTEN